jgi:hypothetical protein
MGCGAQKTAPLKAPLKLMTRAAAILPLWAALAAGQSLPLEPPHEAGSGITGAFEGWFKNSDSTFSLLLGYFNRNQKQDLDIPIGPNNRIEPDGPDRGQPTHFLPGRQWGMFVVKVPADFKNKITWTLTANGKTTAIPASLHPDYEISPLVEAAVGNTPPILRFEQNGPSVQGPAGMTVERSAAPGMPLTITVWVSDDAKFTSSSSAPPKNLPPPVRLRWSKFRGTGMVKFSEEKPPVEKIEDKSAAFSGKAVTTITFSEPGDYVLHVVANDYSGEGGGGFQCCWTNAEVKVVVK